MKPASGQAMRALIESASAAYRSAGRFAYHCARGKLTADPAFETILSRGLLTDRRHILDLGCGQGLLAAWLEAAQTAWHAGRWPELWPKPPFPTAFRGIELIGRSVERARLATGSRAHFVEDDVRRADFGRADGIVILDVLHYIDYADQLSILERVRRALPVDGVLLMRIGDAAGGLGFIVGKWVDRMVLLACGLGLRPLHCRSAAEWGELLSKIGFDCKTLPMSAGTPFANVLIIATAR